MVGCVDRKGLWRAVESRGGLFRVGKPDCGHSSPYGFPIGAVHLPVGSVRPRPSLRPVEAGILSRYNLYAVLLPVSWAVTQVSCTLLQHTKHHMRDQEAASESQVGLPGLSWVHLGPTTSGWQCPPQPSSHTEVHNGKLNAHITPVPLSMVIPVFASSQSSTTPLGKQEQEPHLG